MKILVNKDKRLFLYKNEFLVEGENKVDKLEFEFPSELENYIKFIVISSDEGNYIDLIIDNEYIITRAISNLHNISIAVICTNSKIVSELTKVEDLNNLENVIEFRSLSIDLPTMNFLVDLDEVENDNNPSPLAEISKIVKENSIDIKEIKQEAKTINERLKNIENLLKNILSKLTKFRVTIENGELQDKYGNNISSELIEDTRAFAVASETDKEGRKFAYWEDYSNNIMSYDKKYDFFVFGGDVFLRAVYKEETVQKEPIIAFRANKYEVSEEEKYIKFFTTIDVPEEFEVLEWGVIISTKTDDLRYDNGTVVRDWDENVEHSRRADSAIRINNTKMFTEHRLVRAVVYAVIKKAEEEQQEIYSELLKVQF